MGDRHDSRVANGEGRIGARIYQPKRMDRGINTSPLWSSTTVVCPLSPVPCHLLFLVMWIVKSA